MGRENYLCRRRLDETMAEAGEMLPDHERALALAYLLGRVRRGEVDLSSLPYRASRELTALPGLARELRSTRASCMGRHCPRRSVCLWRAARRRAETSHLVCVNHALLLTGRDTLPPFEDVVIDEAHLLYHEAGEAFSESIDSTRLSMLLSDLGTGGKRRLARRLLAAARRSGPADAGVLTHAARACERAAASLPDLIQSMGEALSTVAAYAAAVRSEEGRRPPESGGEGYDISVWLTHGLREDSSWDGLVTVSALLADELTALATAAGAALETISEEHADHPAVAAVADQAAALAGLLEELSEPSGDEHVLWAEIEAPRTIASRGRPGAAWSVTRTPLVPGRQVREALWDRLHSAVLASATLTVAGSFSYFRDMSGLGADLDVREEVFPSPFDFRRQAVLLLEHDPHSAWRPQELAERQGERIKRLAEVTRGRMLALFTNKRDMQRVAAAVGAHVEADGVLVLAQGLHGSAATLAEEFRAHPQTILLGVDTLWTGQDFPGDALICLVIAKLPFPRQDPLFQARRRAYEEAGESWFQRFYLPEAVLKFRQGFGRLIRTETDSGVVVVLDHRLAEKGYRRQFLASIPELEVLEVSPADLPAAVEDNLLRLTAPVCVPARKR
jgi:Rad3-related DNA helicase